MKKEQSVNSVQKAREAHLLQMEKIHAIIEGKKVNNPTAVSKKECDFGHWIYDEKNHVRELIGSQFYSKLDILHEQWHKEYFKIYNIFFKEEKKRGLFSKFLGRSSVDALEIDKAKLYYVELQATTDELLRVLAAAQRRLEALPESKFH
ncbi:MULTISPECIES: CZB domain-containing protein [Sulfurimonas]|uniref:CZB domain-containing protein n=1 Tax=Sulfurimonas TaxID=202746 RepID=UPI0012658C7D|nr:CZB domain-containing protein [Sulfurimonas indica]